MTINLDSLLQRHEKTAAAKAAPAARAPTAPAAKPSEKTASAVQAALDGVTQPAQGATKTASTASPVADALDKLAADVASQDRESSIKLAALCGQVMADTFASQIGMYEKVAAELQAKTASVAGTLQPVQVPGLDSDMVALVKEASENPKAFLARVQQRASEMDAQDKVAEEQYVQQLTQAVHMKAAEHYAVGYDVGKMMVTPR